jgi:hypothetical protein
MRRATNIISIDPTFLAGAHVAAENHDGLKTAPATFQSIIMEVFEEYILGFMQLFNHQIGIRNSMYLWIHQNFDASLQKELVSTSVLH